MEDRLQRTPAPPYYAVIFTSQLADDRGYEEMATQMAELAQQQPGCLGFDSARGDDGVGITVSYWRDEAAIAAWKAHADHRVAQGIGIERFYAAYTMRVARVERAYAGPAGRTRPTP